MSKGDSNARSGEKVVGLSSRMQEGTSLAVKGALLEGLADGWIWGSSASKVVDKTVGSKLGMSIPE